MNSNGTNGSITIPLQHANPLLFTLPQDHMTIEPYWIIVIQMLTLQTILRIWSRYRYKLYHTTLEIGLIRWILWLQIKFLEWGLEKFLLGEQDLEPSESEKSKIIHLKERHQDLRRKLKFDIFDFIVYFLPICGHIIWYCHIQSSCMSAEYATTWNCYNVFGYRLFNYVFVSYFTFYGNFVMKCLAVLEGNREKWRKGQEYELKTEPPRNKNKLKRITAVVGVTSSIITFIFGFCVFLPYIFTNVIPMICNYAFICIIYLSIWPCVFLLGFLSAKFSTRKILICVPKFISEEFRGFAFSLAICALPFYIFPILISTLFNYSQYVYYGDDHFQTMKDEFHSRNTTTFLTVLENSTNQKLHFALAFL